MMTSQTDRVVLCQADEVSEECPLRREANGVALAIFRLGDAFFALDDHCSHGPGSLSEGYVDGAQVECPFHQGRFDIRTGEAVGAPCTEPVRSWPLAVIDGVVTLVPCEEGILKA